MPFQLYEGRASTVKRYVVIFEAEGGVDKGSDGHRADSAPLLKALRGRGFDGEVCFFRPGQEAALLKRYSGKASVALSRVNPGDLEDTDAYWTFLKALSDAGAIVQTHPDVMSQLSFKELFYHLRDTPYAASSTDYYRSVGELRRRLPLALSGGPRVLKKNFTSTGVGVWKIERIPGGAVRCTEAVDNTAREFSDEAELMRFLEPVFHERASPNAHYFRGRQGLLDVPYLPHIQDGEVRVFLIRDQPFQVLHKQPMENSFSATLFSGAKYSADARLGRWKSVVEYTLWGVEHLRRRLFRQSFPVIWSIDSIPCGDGRYVFSDINAASVGFSSPELVESVSELIAQALSDELAGVDAPASMRPTLI